MLPFLTEPFGNPSLGARVRADGAGGARRGPRAGRGAARTPSRARSCSRRGGTEAINLALKGAAWAGKARGHRIVTTAVEHHAVGHTLRYLEKFGFEIVELPVDRYGRVDPDELAAALDDGRSSSSSCSPTTRSARSSRSPRSPRGSRRRKGVLAPRRRRPGRAVRRARRRSSSGADLVSLGAPQVRGTQGRRRAVRPPRDAHPRPAARRRAGALPPRRHRERRRRGRDGRGVRAGGAERPATVAAAPARRATG